MNILMIKILVLKDWYLHRIAITLALIGLSIGIILSSLSGTTFPSIGFSMIMCIVIALMFYLPLSTVLSERNEKTLPFILSLPVSPSEYTTSKIVMNFIVFLIPLAGMSICSHIMIIDDSGHMAGISTNHLYVLLLGILVFYSFLLGFSLITESMGWTVTLIVLVVFFFGNVVLQVVPKIPTVRQFMSDIANGGKEFFIVLSIEFVLIIAILLLTYWVQVRKKNFL